MVSKITSPPDSHIQEPKKKEGLSNIFTHFSNQKKINSNIFNKTTIEKRKNSTHLKQYTQNNFLKRINNIQEKEIRLETISLSQQSKYNTPAIPHIDYEIITPNSRHIKPSPHFKYKGVKKPIVKRNLELLNSKGKIIEKITSIMTNDQSSSKKSETINNSNYSNQNVHVYKINLHEKDNNLRKSVSTGHLMIHQPKPNLKHDEEIVEALLGIHGDRKEKKPELNYRNRIFNYTQFVINPQKEKFQCFGSTSLRGSGFQTIISNIGPGSYEIDRNPVSKKAELMKKKKNFKIIRQNEPKQQLKIDSDISPGPGHYTIAKSFLKKKFSKLGKFQSTEKRFNNNKSDGVLFPGPGQYLKIPQWKIVKKENPNPIFVKYPTIFQKSKSCENLYINQEIEKIIERVKTKIMDEKIKQQNASTQQNFAPFGVKEPKFKKISNFDENENGPGTYFSDIMHKIPEKDLKPQVFFKSVNKKGILFRDNEYKDVPHCFRNDSYFEWNKKSFNITYNKT